MSKHARLSPSGSSRWLKCTASISETEGMVEKTSSYANEGTTAHTVHEAILSHKQLPINTPEQMMQAVRTSTDYIEEQLSDYCSFEVEVKLPLTSYGIKGLDGGTADVLIIHYDLDFDKTVSGIEVADYKHGAGVSVDVKDNTQLMSYGLGAVIKLKLADEVPVKLTVMQPRCFHKDGLIRSWTISAGRLRKWADTVMVPAAKIAISGQGRYYPSKETCRWCLANGKCKGQDKKYAQMLKPHTPKDDSIINHLDSIRAYLTAIEKEAHEKVLNGSTEYPMFKIVKKRKREKLIEEAGSVLSTEYPDKVSDMFTDKVLKTPSQLKKILPPSVIEELVAKTTDELVVVSIYDSRNGIAK